MRADLRCLRCQGSLVPGKIRDLEQIHPAVWYPGLPEEPQPGLRLLGKPEAASRRQRRSEVMASRAYVDAYRCDSCGRVELFATRHVGEPQAGEDATD